MLTNAQTVTADLHALGYRNQISVDFSKIVIEAMKTKYASLESDWRVMDVRKLELEGGTVDIAIDKGTLDAFIHGSLWDPPQDVRENVGAYVDEVYSNRTVNKTERRSARNIRELTLYMVGCTSLEARRQMDLHYIPPTSFHETSPSTRRDLGTRS